MLSFNEGNLHLLLFVISALGTSFPCRLYCVDPLISSDADRSDYTQAATSRISAVLSTILLSSKEALGCFIVSVSVILSNMK